MRRTDRILILNRTQYLLETHPVSASSPKCLNTPFFAIALLKHSKRFIPFYFSQLIISIVLKRVHLHFYIYMFLVKTGIFYSGLLFAFVEDSTLYMLTLFVRKVLNLWKSGILLGSVEITTYIHDGLLEVNLK